MKFIGIIPARYASTRFPGKPLADLAGKPMIQRVYEQVQNVLDSVCVATDDNRIEAAVQAFGGNVIMTSDQHKSGTDRCYEAYCKIGDGYDVVVNIQGDEPFIQPEQIEILKACFIDDSIQIATLVKPFRPDDDFETTLFNANSPKVVLNKKNEAMYFSRSIIPYMRGRKYTEWLPNHNYYKHIGLYAYRAEQQHVKRKLHRRHIQRSTVDHHDIERIRERRSHDQHNARSIEYRTALTPVQQRDSAQSQGNGEDRDQRNSLPEENRHDDGHHDRIDEKKGGGDPRIHIVKTHEQRERRYGEHHSQQSQHGELPARNAQRSFLHQQQGCQQYGGKRIAVKQHGIGVYSRPVE